jgi:hypothetical protein
MILRLHHAVERARHNPVLPIHGVDVLQSQKVGMPSKRLCMSRLQVIVLSLPCLVL